MRYSFGLNKKKLYGFLKSLLVHPLFKCTQQVEKRTTGEKSCKIFLSRELFYLRLNVILEIVDEISRGTISRDNKDFPIVALGLANSNFCRSLPHNLCEVARAAFKARVFEVVPTCIERNKDTRSTLYDCFFFFRFEKNWRFYLSMICIELSHSGSCL